MNDIERAAELAFTVLPGPIGEAVAVVLADHMHDKWDDPNIHELAYRICQAKASLDGSGHDDILRASVVAELIHPGPVGTAINALLTYAAVTGEAFRNIHIVLLAAAVLDAAPGPDPQPESRAGGVA